MVLIRIYAFIRSLIKKLVFALLYNNAIQIDSHFRVGKLFDIRIFKRGTVRIGKNFEARKYVNIFSDSGQITIGDDVFFNNGCSINAMLKVCIGDNCLFGENVKIYDHNHIFNNKNKPISKQGFDVGRVIIGSNSWIGSNVTILRNVTIGDNVVIGANCLIYKSVQSNSVIKNKSELIITGIN